MDIIKRIEKELNNSTSSEYVCQDGTTIATDVGYISDWFNRYKETLKVEENI